MISLEKDYIRRSELKSRFPINYPLFKWVKAVDASKETSTNLDKKFNVNTKYKTSNPLTYGEKCCAISHLCALKNFIESNANYCLIIEDDLIGCDKDFKNLPIFAEKVMHLTDSAIIILGGQQGLKNSKYLSGYYIIENLWRIPKISQYFITRACCYLITKQAALEIIEKQSNKLIRSDQWLELCSGDIKLYYSNVFKHPIDLRNSRLENDRKLRNIFSKLRSDGVGHLFNRNILKLISCITIFLKISSKVTIK